MTLNDLDPTTEQPQRVLIDERAQLPVAMDILLATARIEVICMQHNLEPLGLGQMNLVERLEKLLTTHRGARVRLLVDDTHWLDTQAPRLRALHRHMTHALQLRQASESDPVGEDCVVVVDHRHVLNLKIGKLVHGDLWLHHPLNAQPWCTVFERRWEHASHDLPGSPLGL